MRPAEQHRVNRFPRVLMVSTSYPADFSDWRGLFIRNLVDALGRRPDLFLELWAPSGQVPSSVELVTSAEESAWLARLMASGGVAHVVRGRSLETLVTPIRLLKLLRKIYTRSKADVFHVNWLQNALALPRDGRPLLLTALGTDMQLLRLPLMRAWLRMVFRNRNVIICPNADWMTPILSRAFGDVAKIRLVPFGIDPSWFRMERSVPNSEPHLWLCVTRLTEGKIGHLLEWGANEFATGSRELHLFGPMQQEIPLPSWVHYHGPATPEALCGEWFPRADGLITLSRHAEGRPQVVLEAMAAGLPVIASRLPAHSDMIQHGCNGLLCDSAAEFGHALNALEDADANVAIGLQGRRWARKNIGTWDDCAARYAALYSEILEECDHG